MNKQENTGLTVKKQQGLQVISPVQSDNKIVIALQTLRIYEATDKQIVSYLSPAIEKARFDLGLKTDNINSKDNLLFIDSILRDLKDHFGAMTIGEIPIAVYNFSRGHYHAPDKDVFLTPGALSKGFKAYTNEPKRMQAKQELLMLQAPTEEELTPDPEAVEKERIRLIVNAFDVFYKTGTYDDHFNVIYKSIEVYKPIPFNIDKKKEIVEKARQFLIAENKSQSADIHERNKKKINLKVLELITMKDIPISEAMKQMKETLKIQAQKFALIEFFKQLQKENKHIRSFLEIIKS